METQKFVYLKIEKSFLEEIKSIFCNYLRAVIWWKKMKKKEKADTIFKGCVRYIFANLFCMSIRERL